MAILTLSLALVWGYCGIICFGQTAFFGLGGYTYAVAAINFGDSTPAIAVALVVPTVFAVLLGYFMFWGRVTDVYLGVITLTVTLILYKLFNATAGDAYHIGKAALGGFNGIPATPLDEICRGTAIPRLNPRTSGTSRQRCSASPTLLCAGCCPPNSVASWWPSGRTNTAPNSWATIRGASSWWRSRSAALMAGASGILFANCVFVSPTMFSLLYTAQVIVWVIIGGLGTLLGPVFACFLLQMITAELGRLNWLNPNFVLGVILIAFVLLMPSGILPTLQRAWERLSWPTLSRTLRRRPAQ